MLRLLRWDDVRRIARHPGSVEVLELLTICHQIFWVQFVVGVAGFLPAARSRTLGLETVLNVVVPLIGVRSTREVEPENYRVVRLTAAYWFAGTVYGLLHCMVCLEYQEFPWVLVKTLVSGIQWLAMARLWRLLMDEKMTSQSFFLNVVVLNKKEVVKAQAQIKTGWGEKVGTRSLGRLTGALANRAVSAEKFSQILGGQMCESLPLKMAENGIKAFAELQFARGNLLVLQVTIEGVDVRTLVAKKAGPECAAKISGCLNFLPERARDELTDIMLSQIASQLLKVFPAEVAAQLQDEGGVEVAADARTRKEEAQYLFALLAQLDRREAEEARPRSLGGA